MICKDLLLLTNSKTLQILGFLLRICKTFSRLTFPTLSTLKTIKITLEQIFLTIMVTKYHFSLQRICQVKLFIFIFSDKFCRPVMSKRSNICSFGTTKEINELNISLPLTFIDMNYKCDMYLPYFNGNLV